MKPTAPWRGNRSVFATALPVAYLFLVRPTKRTYMIRLLLTATVASALFSAPYAIAEVLRDRSADTAELTRLAIEAGHAYACRDVAALERLTAEDYVQTDVRGGVLSRTQWLAFVKNRKSELTVESDSIEVRFYGEVAVVTGRWKYTLKESSRDSVSNSRWTSVWTRDTGGWKRSVFQNTYVNADADQQMISGAVLPRSAQGAADGDFRKIVSALSGKWSIRETSDNGSTTGEEVWQTGPGGMPLVEEFRASKASGEKLNDYAAVWWDSKTKKIRGVWCADFNDQGCTPFEVTWRGSDIEMAGEYDGRGKATAWREVFHVTSLTSFTQILYMGTPGEELKKVSTIVAEKKP
jgi:ketosteroid isomerase-like protein